MITSFNKLHVGFHRGLISRTEVCEMGKGVCLLLLLLLLLCFGGVGAGRGVLFWEGVKILAILYLVSHVKSNNR